MNFPAGHKKKKKIYNWKNYRHCIYDFQTHKIMPIEPGVGRNRTKRSTTILTSSFCFLHVHTPGHTNHGIGYSTYVFLRHRGFYSHLVIFSQCIFKTPFTHFINNLALFNSCHTWSMLIFKWPTVSCWSGSLCTYVSLMVFKRLTDGIQAQAVASFL